MEELKYAKHSSNLSECSYNLFWELSLPLCVERAFGFSFQQKRPKCKEKFLAANKTSLLPE